MIRRIVKMIRDKKGANLVDWLILVMIVAGIALGVTSMVGAGFKITGNKLGTDLSTIKVNVGNGVPNSTTDFSFTNGQIIHSEVNLK